MGTNFSDGLTDGMTILRRKTLVSDLWSIGEFIGNNFTDGFTDDKSVQKKNLPALSIDISINEYNISPTKKLYIIPSVIFFVCQYSSR